MLTQCLAALQHTHTAGVLHRDVHCGNILVDACVPRAYLADFGLATLADTAVPAKHTADVCMVLSRAPEILFSGRWAGLGLQRVCASVSGRA